MAAAPTRRPFTHADSGQLGTMINRQNVVIGQLEETVNVLATRLQGISAGHMLALGVQQNPEAVAQGQNMALERNPRGAEAQQRANGRYF